MRPYKQNNITKWLSSNNMAISDIEKQAISCEHGHQGRTLVDIECEAGTTVEIQSARYGRSDGDTCPTTPGYNSICTDSADHSHVVRGACQGKANCQYHGTNDVSGDPCGGVEKYTVIEYTCVEG